MIWSAPAERSATALWILIDEFCLQQLVFALKNPGEQDAREPPAGCGRSKEAP